MSEAATARRPAMPGSASARLADAVALERAGRTGAAHDAFAALAAAEPGWDEPSLRLALLMRSAGETRAARAAYEGVLEINPSRTEALLGLGALLIGAGEPGRALILLLRCCGVAPALAEAWDALGLALLLTGDARSAETAYAEAQRLAPGVIAHALSRAEAALAAGSTEAELARLALFTAADPLDIPSLCARGLLLSRTGALAEAADLLEVAAALAPDAPAPAMLHARALAALDRAPEAAAAYARARALDPDNPNLLNDQAAMLMRAHRHAEARPLLESLIAQHGREAAYVCNLASTELALGEQASAVRLAREAIERAPDAMLPWRTLCNVMPYWEGATAQALTEALSACARRLPRAPAPDWPNAPDPDRKLRIGLLSGSLRVHPVGWLTIAGVETLDPAAFEIVCFAQGRGGDPLTARFRARAAAWHETGGLDDAALAAGTREAGIDVLVDLGGYGDGGRMAACARRLAPVQVKWVGMQNHTTGLPEMDWLIADRWEIPPGLEPLYVERILRLRDGYVCYSPPPYAPDIGKLPAEANGFVTFGCFNNLSKLTPSLLAAWARILAATPGARLVLRTHPFADAPTAERMRARLAHAGIDPARVALEGPAPHRRFLADYGRIDIVLDPFPYTGGLTTCEALWMGVPAVSLAGETFAARHGVSHLCNAGLADWVAEDVDAYVDLACAKAADLQALARLRARLRPRMAASPLCDAPRFGAALGAALRAAWRDWCARSSRLTEGSPR